MPVNEGRLLYEVSVLARSGAMRPPDLSAFGVTHAGRTPEQTVISLRHSDGEQVHRLVGWLTDLRLEVFSIRRCRASAPDGHSDEECALAAAASTSYEVGVMGRVGPVLLSTFPHDAVRIVPAHTVLLFSGWDAVLRVLDALVAADIPVQSVRRSAGVGTPAAPMRGPMEG